MPSRTRPSSAPRTTAHLPAFTRRGLLAAALAGPPAAALVVTAPPVHADPAVAGGETRIVDVPLAAQSLGDADGVRARLIDGHRLTMVGVTWDDADDVLDVKVRAQAEDGTWSRWFRLEQMMDPETGAPVGGTDLAWIGVATALQLRVEADGAEAGERATAHLVTTSPAKEDAAPVRGTGIEPGADGADGDDGEESGSGLGTGSGAGVGATGIPRLLGPMGLPNPATPALGPGAPAFVSRAAWGADESITGSTSGASSLKGIVIHHTEGSNSYSSSTSPQIVRGIQAYHASTLGWADVGYNLLIDKYGQIFEGRAGGLHRNIVGAHARGFNTGTFGISVMGSYMTSAPPQAALDAVARVIGWKLLGAFRTRATDSVTWTPGTTIKHPAGVPVSLPRVFGHRDVNFTDCPGDAFYSKLGSLRSAAQGRIDAGWRTHLDAFSRAGGEAALGTVVRSAHSAGRYWFTELTKGIVLSEGTGSARGYRSEVASSWKPTWGRPLRDPLADGARRIQPFEGGVAAVESGRRRFVQTRFKDVRPNQQFFLEIHDLAGRGITTGWPDGTFRPLAPVQRDAVVAFLYRAMGSPAFTPPARSPFRDLSPRTMFYKEITWAKAKGIVQGWSDGTFRPTASIQRAAIAAMLMRAAGASGELASSPFRDVPASHQFAREIGWASNRGITRGWPDGTFRPWDATNRDAMAAFMMRWLALTGR